MAFSRAISRSLAAISAAQSMRPAPVSQPKPWLSAAAAPYSAAITISFFGTQPTLTQVPPQKRSSATATRAPWPAAMRAQRTPPRAAADDEQIEVHAAQAPMPPRARYLISR